MNSNETRWLQRRDVRSVHEVTGILTGYPVVDEGAAPCFDVDSQVNK